MFADSVYKTPFDFPVKDIMVEEKGFPLLLHRVATGNVRDTDHEDIPQDYPFFVAAPCGKLELEGREADFVQAMIAANTVAWTLTITHNILGLYNQEHKVEKLNPELLDTVLNWCDEIIHKEHRAALSEAIVVKQSIENYRIYLNRPLSESGGYGYVYLAHSETGGHKIGRSKKPIDRIKLFDTQMPIDVTMVHVIETDDCVYLEKCLHKHFANRRFKGEWFNLFEREIDAIKGVAEWRCHRSSFTFDGSQVSEIAAPDLSRSDGRFPSRFPAKS